MVFPQYAFSDVSQDPTSVWNFCYIEYTERVSLRYVFFDVFEELSYMQNTFYIDYIEMASPQYVFSGDTQGSL